MRFAASALLVGASTSSVYGDTQQPLASYTPFYPVTDEAVLDLDQKALEDVGLDENAGAEILEQMLEIYTDGGNSRPIAIVSLIDELPVRLEEGTVVQGISLVDGNPVTGKLASVSNAGATQLRIAYDVNEDYAEPGNCRVGAFPESVVDSCFDVAGNFTIDGKVYAYDNYDPEDDTVSGRPLQSLSTNANYHREGGSHDAPFHDQMQSFINYYGTADYADRIIMSALLDDVAGLQSGSLETQGLSVETKSEVVTSATVLLNVFMMVISQLKKSVHYCSILDAQIDLPVDDAAFNEEYDTSIHALDAAVAYYTGSTQGEGNPGHMLYFWSDVMCGNMNTCVGAESSHNLSLFSMFESLSDHLGEIECQDGEDILEEAIIPQLRVPLIQGVLYYAYLVGELDAASPELEATGAVFAASVLPLLSECDETAAEIVYDNMRLGGDSTSFGLVKAILEENYDCLQVTCSMIGGVYDGEKYFDGAEPCEFKQDDDDEGEEIGYGDDDIEVPIDDDDKPSKDGDDVEKQFFVDDYIRAPVAAIIGVAAFFATALLFAVCRCCLKRICCCSSSSKEAIVDSSQLDESEADLSDRTID